MTPNKYATLRGTIARAKRNDCQKVVMRVTLVEELLLQLSNTEKRIDELATENAWLKQFPDQIVGFIGKLGSSEIGSETKDKIEAAAKKIKTPATDAFQAEVITNAIKSALSDCSECLDRDCILDSNGISYEDAALREAGAMALHDALLRQERAV